MDSKNSIYRRTQFALYIFLPYNNLNILEPFENK